MSHVDIARLQGIKTLAQLTAYLRDELDWPIEAGDTDDITFDYDAAELGLDPKSAVLTVRPTGISNCLSPWKRASIRLKRKSHGYRVPRNLAA